MTAINVLCQAGAVHLFADSRFYGPEGASLFAPKLWPLPHLNAVIGLRGPKLLAPVLAAELGSLFTTYDALKDNLAAAVRWIVVGYPDLTRGHPDPDALDIVVAGISAATGPDAFLLCTHDRFAPPWVTHSLMNGMGALPASRGLAMLPSSRQMYPAITDVIDAAGGVGRLDPIADGIRLAEIQRAMWPCGVDTAPTGFLQLMTVTETGIATRIIHRWPPEVFDVAAAA